MSVKKITSYKCPSCGILFDKKSKAIKCCTKYIDEEHGYVCSVCGMIWEEKKMARNCAKLDKMED